MIDLAATVATARYNVVTTLDTGETAIAKARTLDAAERLMASAKQAVGKPDWQGRVRTSVELIDAAA